MNKLYGFVNKYIKEKQKPVEIQEEIKTAPLLLPKKFNFRIQSFKLTLIVDDNEANTIRLKENISISRTFELNVDKIDLGFNFKRHLHEKSLEIQIGFSFKMEKLLLQAEEIGDYFVFCNLENLELKSEYFLNESKEDKATTINLKNTLNVLFFYYFW